MSIGILVIVDRSAHLLRERLRLGGNVMVFLLDFDYIVAYNRLLLDWWLKWGLFINYSRATARLDAFDNAPNNEDEDCARTN